MIEKDKLIKIGNRGGFRVGYQVPELNVNRQFTKREIKEVPFEELRALSFLNGGFEILKNHLIIFDEEAAAELLNEDIEPEYYYTDKEIKYLLTEASLEELEDCLDFAPTGVIDIVKKMAIDLEIYDGRKKEAIQKKTGVNIDGAIKINHIAKEDLIEEESPETHKRRVQPKAASLTEEKKTERRTKPTLPKYDVVE